MKTNEKKNTSAKKKLIPAVAMLTTSAVMLSTATYAWFTMNKTAEVNGLEMAATAGGGLEISLGQIGDGTLGRITTPLMNDTSWKSTVKIGEYYENIGKIMPASSVEGNKLFYASDRDITAGGKVVEDSATVSQTTDENAVKLTVKNNYDKSGTTNAVAKDDSSKGYYVDIPMWIRTTYKVDTTVKCEVTIKDATTTIDGAVDGADLQKAVRVAVIPLGKANIKADSTANSLAITPAHEYTVDGNTNVFGLTFDSYNKDTNEKAISNAKDANTAYSTVLSDITSNAITVDVGENAHSDTANIFTLKAAAANSYSVESFVVRVWLEGESIYCNDANAAQDWNVQLNFTTADTTSTGV